MDSSYVRKKPNALGPGLHKQGTEFKLNEMVTIVGRMKAEPLWKKGTIRWDKGPEVRMLLKMNSAALSWNTAVLSWNTVALSWNTAALKAGIQWRSAGIQRRSAGIQWR